MTWDTGQVDCLFLRIMAVLITPGFTSSFSEISLANNIPFDDFSQKIVKIISDWKEGKEFSMLTSGSTGEPKKIILDREVMMASALQSVHTFGLRSDDTFLCCLSTDHIAGLMMVIRALVINANLIVIPPGSSPFENLPLTITSNPTFAALVPMQVENSLNNQLFKNLKRVIVGGAPVSSGLEEKIRDSKVPMYQTYGMTETYTHVALRKLNGEYASNTYFALEGIHFTKDERDCLVIHAPELKIASLITNDVVDIIDDTHFIWHGRIDNVINSGGIKIQLEKIERAAENVLAEGISLFATGIKDEKLGEKLAIVIEVEIWSDDLISTLIINLQKTLSSYETPKEFIFVKEFKRTALGKIDRIGTLKNVIIG